MPDVFPAIGNPAWGLADRTKDEVYTVKMGDGYILAQPKGINHQREVWNPKWNDLAPAVAASTYAWLKARKEVTPFLWDHPDGYQVQVRCTNVTMVRTQFGISALEATFEEDFNP